MGARDIDTPSEAYTNSVPDQLALYPDGQYTLELIWSALRVKVVAIPVVH